MGMESAFDEMIDLARRVGLRVRHVHLGGNGGGLARIKGAGQLFIDLDAHPLDQLEQTARALACVSEVDVVFVRPDVRELLEKYREEGRELRPPAGPETGV